MKEFLKFVKTSGIYFAGSVLVKIISFFLLPIYTKYINPGDYGTYDLITAYVTFLCSVLFLDIWSGVMRFMFEYKDEKRGKPITTGLAIFSISSIVYTCVLLGVGGAAGVKYLPFIYLYGLLMNVQNLMGYIVRGYGKNILYVSGGLLGSLVTILFNILLLVYSGMDYSALFIASCIGYVVNILVLAVGIKVWKIIRISYFDKKLFLQMAKYSLPLCVNSVAYWFLTSYNRVAVSDTLGTEANGLYAIANRFGSVVTLFTSCFQMAWQEISFAKSASNAGDEGAFYSKAINAYIKTLCLGIAVSIPVVYVIFPIMVDSSYYGAEGLVPILLTATVASTISSFLGSVFGAVKRTGIIFTTTVLGSIINVILVHLLMPYIGVQAANVALLTGFLATIIVRLVLLNRQMHISIDLKQLIVILILLGCVTLLYFKADIWVNLLGMVIVGFIGIIMYRDILCQMWGRIREKSHKNHINKE